MGSTILSTKLVIITFEHNHVSCIELLQGNRNGPHCCAKVLQFKTWNLLKKLLQGDPNCLLHIVFQVLGLLLWIFQVVLRGSLKDFFAICVLCLKFCTIKTCSLFALPLFFTFVIISSLNIAQFKCLIFAPITFKYQKFKNSLGGLNIWQPYHNHRTKFFGSIGPLLRALVEVICPPKKMSFI